MDVQLRDFQLDCLEKVCSKISDGAKHLSVVMTVGIGQKQTSMFLAKRLYSEEQAKIAMVFAQMAVVMQSKSNAEKLGMESVDFFSTRQFAESDGEYQYVIFHDASTYERIQIRERIKNMDCITISFSAPGQELSSENDSPHLSSYFKQLSPIVCVYVTKEVLDIKDARYAEAERVYVHKENAATVNWLQQMKDQAVSERDAIQRQNERLQAYMKAFKQEQEQDQQKIKEQAAEIERLKALLQADERDKKIEELEAREAEYQEQLNEKDARIAQQDQMIAFQQEVLSGFGIDAKIIQESFEKIQNARASLQADLESDDESVKEFALKLLQDMVAEIVSDLTRSVLSLKDQDYYEASLISDLSEEVWKKMDDKSKAYLITAKCNYDSMVQMKDSEAFDYSGVCLLVTKALEVEVAKRFFYKYKNYLTGIDPVFSWPFAMRHWEQGHVTQKPMDDNEFTLGSVVSIVGMKRDYDTGGSIVGYSLAHRGTRNKFRNYAKTELFDFSDDAIIDAEIEKDYLFIEKVREDYRNPAAHRDRLTMTSAKECFDYVISVHGMLKEMLTAMKI